MAVRRADLGPASAWAEAVAEGYTGSREDWARALASASTAAQRVEDAAEIVARAVDVDTALQQVDAGLQMVTTWTTGAQMINPAGVVSGKLNAAGTAVGADSVFETTGWIPVQALQEYKVGRWGSGRWGTGTDYVNRWAAYSARDLSTVIGTASSTACTEFTTPEGAAFVRFSYKATYTGLLMAPAESFPEEWEDYGRQYTLSSDLVTETELETAEQTIYNAVGAVEASYSWLNGPAGATEIDSWADLVDAFETGGEYVLTADLTYDSEAGKIVSSAAVTIYGRGHKINCGGQTSPIKVSGSVRLYDLEIWRATGALLYASNGMLYLRHCCLHNATGTGSRLVRGETAARIVLQDCELYGSTGDDGFSLDDEAAGYLYGCRIHACKDEGITTHGDSYCEVINCEVWECGYDISVGGSATDYAITVDKTAKGAASSYGGIHLGGTGLGVVRGCYSHDNATYGIGLYCMTAGSRAGKAVCTGNLVLLNGATLTQDNDECGGIIVAGVKDCEIRSNMIQFNGGYGLRFGLDGVQQYISTDFASAGFVTGNTLSGNTVNTITIDTGADGGLWVNHSKTLPEMLKDLTAR